MSLAPAFKLEVPPVPGADAGQWAAMTRAERAAAWRETGEKPDIPGAVQAVSEAGRWVFHTCSMCDYPCAFIYDEGDWFYDSGCHCTRMGSGPQPTGEDQLVEAFEMNPHLAAAVLAATASPEASA